MANELGPIRYAAGASLTCTLTNDAGQVWNVTTSAWVTAATATYSQCTIAMAEQGTTGRYYASLPAGVDATGRYSVAVNLAAATTWGDLANMVAEGEYLPQPATVAAVAAIPTSPLLAVNYTVPDNTLTLTTLGTALDARSLDATHQNRLDAAVSSRNAVAPDNVGVAAIKLKTDALPAVPAARGDIPTDYQQRGQVVSLPAGVAQTADIPSAAAIAAAVWGYAQRGLTTFGTLAAEVWGYAQRLVTGPQADQLASAANDAAANKARLAIQVPGAGPVVVFPAAPTGATIAYCYCRKNGLPSAGALLEVCALNTAGSGYAYSPVIAFGQADATGLASVVIDRTSAVTFAARVNGGTWCNFKGVDAATVEVPSVIAGVTV